MSNFEHDYYFPSKDRKRATVLCMRCEFPVITQEYTKEDIRAHYREMKIEWDGVNGRRVIGVIILCQDCEMIDLKADDLPKIYRQIIKGLDDEAAWANLPRQKELLGKKILGQFKEAI